MVGKRVERAERRDREPEGKGAYLVGLHISAACPQQSQPT